MREYNLNLSSAMVYIKNLYYIETLELQQTRLKCINLGFNPSKDVKVELDLIDLSLKEIESRWK